MELIGESTPVKAFTGEVHLRPKKMPFKLETRSPIRALCPDEEKDKSVTNPAELLPELAHFMDIDIFSLPRISQRIKAYVHMRIFNSTHTTSQSTLC